MIACKLFPLLKSRPNKVNNLNKEKRNGEEFYLSIGYHTKINSSYVARYE